MKNHIDDNSSPENWAKWLKDVDLDLKDEAPPEIAPSPEPEETFAEIEIPIEEEAPVPAHEALHGVQPEPEPEPEFNLDEIGSALLVKYNAVYPKVLTIRMPPGNAPFMRGTLLRGTEFWAGGETEFKACFRLGEKLGRHLSWLQVFTPDTDIATIDLPTSLAEIAKIETEVIATKADQNAAMIKIGAWIFLTLFAIVLFCFIGSRLSTQLPDANRADDPRYHLEHWEDFKGRN